MNKVTKETTGIDFLKLEISRLIYLLTYPSTQWVSTPVETSNYTIDLTLILNLPLPYHVNMGEAHLWWSSSKWLTDSHLLSYNPRWRQCQWTQFLRLCTRRYSGRKSKISLSFYFCRLVPVSRLNNCAISERTFNNRILTFKF